MLLGTIYGAYKQVMQHLEKEETQTHSSTSFNQQT